MLAAAGQSAHGCSAATPPALPAVTACSSGLVGLIDPLPPLLLQVHNPSGKLRVLVTKQLPGDRWLQLLTSADARVEVIGGTDILSNDAIKTLIGTKCDGVIGQLTEVGTAAAMPGLFAALAWCRLPPF